MNLTDLVQVLDERSSDTAERFGHHTRLHGIRAKVATRRRQRIAAWASCVAIVFGGAVAITILPSFLRHVRPAPAQTPSPVPSIGGFPMYANGVKVVATESGELPTVRLTLTVTTRTPDLVVFSRCDTFAAKVFLEATLSVNGSEFARGDCGGALRSSDWTAMGVNAGKPSTFVMTITGARQEDGHGGVDRPIPDAGTFALAIGERVLYDEYPLPSWPATLRPLTEELPAGCTETLCPGALIFRSDPTDPARPVQRKVTWQALNQIAMVAQTPGHLHLRVNGVKVGVGEWWDYAASGYGISVDVDGGWNAQYGLDLHPGDEVTVDITPEQITGAWQVVFTRQPS